MLINVWIISSIPCTCGKHYYKYKRIHLLDYPPDINREAICNDLGIAQHSTKKSRHHTAMIWKMNCMWLNFNSGRRLHFQSLSASLRPRIVTIVWLRFQKKIIVVRLSNEERMLINVKSYRWSHTCVDSISIGKMGLSIIKGGAVSHHIAITQHST